MLSQMKYLNAVSENLIVYNQMKILLVYKVIQVLYAMDVIIKEKKQKEIGQNIYFFNANYVRKKFIIFYFLF